MHVLTLEKPAKDGLLAGKRVLIRSDLNAPHDENGRITNETRLVASVPAIRTALDLNAHHDHSQFSRIREGQLSSWQSAQSNGSFLMLNSTIRYFRENRMSSSMA